MLIELDQESPNELLDNVLYYMSGFLVKSILKTPKCAGCRSELLLDVDDPNGFKAVSYRIHAKFTCFKQNGGLLFPSVEILKIVKATEVIFKKRVFWQEKGIAREKNLDLKIQYAVLEQLGNEVFGKSLAYFLSIM